ncbi:hypothetical protein ERS070143_01563, partial [Streptococcus pneumoniae]
MTSSNMGINSSITIAKFSYIVTMDMWTYSYWSPTRSQFTDSTETSFILVHQANLMKTSTGFKALSFLLDRMFWTWRNISPTMALQQLI